MKNKQMIKDIYRIAGLLEAITCFGEQTFPQSMTFILNDCVDRLELMGAQLLAEDVKNHEGTEEAAETRFTKDPYQ